MHERFSDRARHAMALANQEASRLHHNYLAPAHLMLGLIAEGTCVATETLRHLRVDLDRVRDQVRGQMPPAEPNDAFGRRAHTGELKQVIQFAIQEARKFHHRYVGTEHLIIGLTAQREGVPARVLADQGVNLDNLRESVLATLRSELHPEHDLAHSRYGDFEWMHQQELAKAFRSPKFWHTLILAVDSANRFGAGEVAPAHLLLALLRDPGSGVADLLAEKGVTADWVRDRLTAQAEAS